MAAAESSSPAGKALSQPTRYMRFESKFAKLTEREALQQFGTVVENMLEQLEKKFGGDHEEVTQAREAFEGVWFPRGKKMGERNATRQAFVAKWYAAWEERYIAALQGSFSTLREIEETGALPVPLVTGVLFDACEDADQQVVWMFLCALLVLSRKVCGKPSPLASAVSAETPASMSDLGITEDGEIDFQRLVNSGFMKESMRAVLSNIPLPEDSNRDELLDGSIEQAGSFLKDLGPAISGLVRNMAQSGGGSAPEAQQERRGGTSRRRR